MESGFLGTDFANGRALVVIDCSSEYIGMDVHDSRKFEEKRIAKEPSSIKSANLLALTSDLACVLLDVAVN